MLLRLELSGNRTWMRRRTSCALPVESTRTCASRKLTTSPVAFGPLNASTVSVTSSLYSERTRMWYRVPAGDRLIVNRQEVLVQAVPTRLLAGAPEYVMVEVPPDLSGTAKVVINVFCSPLMLNEPDVGTRSNRSSP